MKYIILLLSFYLLNPNIHYKYWNINDKLNWGDFQGIPIENSQFSAISTLTILPIISENKRKWNIEQSNFEIYIQINFYNIFQKNLSWVKNKEHSYNLLEHEQIHFDIKELYVRKLIQEVLSLDAINYNNFIPKLNSLIDSIRFENEKTDKLFDSETDFSRNQEQQKKWRVYIDSLLKNYENYSDSTITKKMFLY